MGDRLNIADRHDLSAGQRDALRLKMARKGWANTDGDWQLWQVAEPTCALCGRKFAPGSAATKYCSLRCRRTGGWRGL